MPTWRVSASDRKTWRKVDASYAADAVMAYLGGRFWGGLKVVESRPDNTSHVYSVIVDKLGTRSTIRVYVALEADDVPQ